MSWYPDAVKLELQPESSSQPAIKPTQFILHSVAAPWDEKRIYAYWHDSTNLESHYGLDYDGSLGQYLSTQTRADANYLANRRPDGTGAVSLESASNTKASDPWTTKQLAAIIDLGVWLHKQHGIPLRICRTASDPGYGHHRMFKDWNPNGHSCPGDARAAQFTKTIFPGIVAKAGAPAAAVPPSAVPKVSLAHIVAAQHRDPGLAQGKTTHKAEGLVVEQALYKVGELARAWVDGSLGTKTRTATTAWQKRCGYSGADADGYFGRDSLTKLGATTGLFTVTS